MENELGKPIKKIADKRFHASSFGTGAYEFIPLPFLDDWLINRQRKGMVEAILERRGITYDEKVPRIFVDSGRSLFGKMGSLTSGIVMKPLKKLFRTVFFWLTARNAARTTMVSYLFARFLHHPNLISASEGKHLKTERAEVLSAVFRDVSRNIEIRAAKGAIQQLVGLFARSKKTSAEEIGLIIEKSAPGFISEFDAMVTKRLLESDANRLK